MCVFKFCLRHYAAHWVASVFVYSLYNQGEKEKLSRKLSEIFTTFAGKLGQNNFSWFILKLKIRDACI